MGSSVSAEIWPGNSVGSRPGQDQAADFYLKLNTMNNAVVDIYSVGVSSLSFAVKKKHNFINNRDKSTRLHNRTLFTVIHCDYWYPGVCGRPQSFGGTEREMATALTHPFTHPLTSPIHTSWSLGIVESNIRWLCGNLWRPWVLDLLTPTWSGLLTFNTKTRKHQSIYVRWQCLGKCDAVILTM